MPKIESADIKMRYAKRDLDLKVKEYDALRAEHRALGVLIDETGIAMMEAAWAYDKAIEAHHDALMESLEKDVVSGAPPV